MKKVLSLIVLVTQLLAAEAAQNVALVPNPEYVQQEGAVFDFKTNSPCYTRTVDNTRLIREYCNETGKKTGILIGPLGKWKEADYLSSFAFIPSTTERPVAVEKLLPGTTMDSVFERLKMMKQALRASSDMNSGTATVLFLGAPMELDFKATGGTISSLSVRFSRKDPDGDRMITESLIGFFGKPKEDPYIKESGDDVQGSLGGMQNTYRKYSCSWEKPAYKAVFTANYTHSNSYSAEGKSTEGFYFEGELKVEAVLIAPSPAVTEEVK